MTNFPNASDKAVRRLLDQSKDHLFNLAEQMKIENLSEEFLAEIVTPISLYLDRTFPKRNQPYLFVLRGDKVLERQHFLFLYKKY